MRKIFIFCLAIGLPIIAAATAMNVQVREAQVRETPSFLGRLTATCAYGDQVKVLETRDAWSRVQLSDGTSGWMHTSALTRKQIALRTGDEAAQVKASSDELALAGKGFSSEVESEFKSRHKDIDFTWVDKMEQMRISPAQSRTFLQQGGVQPATVGAQ